MQFQFSKTAGFYSEKEFVGKPSIELKERLRVHLNLNRIQNCHRKLKKLVCLES